MSELMPSHANSWIVESWSQGLAARETPPPSEMLQEGRELQAEMIVRAMTQMLRCADQDEASRLLANRLQQFLGCRQVAVGLCTTSRHRCRIRGLSGVVRFDSHGRFINAIQDALDETLGQQTRTAWPERETGRGHIAIAHERLVAMLGAQCVASLPLRNADGETEGVVLFVDEPAEGAFELIEHYSSALAVCLESAHRKRRGYVARKLQQLRGRLATWRGIALCLAAFAGLLLLAVPWPYHVTSQCQVQPVTRRFIVAPYDGTLEKSLVAPGDVVHAGDVLARMDEQEVRWELSSLQADRARAEKERDAAMAGHRTSGAQLAELETQRLDVEIQLLQHRIENLAIRSPIDGIVVAGDLEKAEGAPLTIGQTLFEVAPLEKMTVEIQIPEEDISYVSPGMPVAISLDAFADDHISGTLQQIHPQAELKENQSVFVAEMELANPHSRLRPGMNGWAEITSERKSLGWILFHKPWTSVRRALAW